MPTVKIADFKQPCNHPEHNPPQFMYFEPGVYRHTCPACGEQQTFTVSGTWCGETYSGSSKYVQRLG